MEKFKVICKKCGSEAELKQEDDGGCGDPECCGGRSYWMEAKCPNCGETEEGRGTMTRRAFLEIKALDGEE